MLSPELVLIAAANETLSPHRATRIAEVAATHSFDEGLSPEALGFVLASAMVPPTCTTELPVREAIFVDGPAVVSLAAAPPARVLEIAPLLRATFGQAVASGIGWTADATSRPISLQSAAWEVWESRSGVGAVATYSMASGAVLAVKFGDALDAGSARIETLHLDAVSMFAAACESVMLVPAFSSVDELAAASAEQAVLEDLEDETLPFRPAAVVLH